MIKILAMITLLAPVVANADIVNVKDLIKPGMIEVPTRIGLAPLDPERRLDSFTISPTPRVVPVLPRVITPKVNRGGFGFNTGPGESPDGYER